jgi:hypothetical protein
MNARSAKRRKKTPFYQSHATSNEERFLQQNSMRYQTDAEFLSTIPQCPVFYPTVQDMEGDALDYIEKIRPFAEQYGLAKIVPPPGWNLPFGKLRAL